MSVTRPFDRWLMPLALVAGLLVGRTAADVQGWVFYGTPLAFLHGPLRMVTFFLPACLPCLAWPLRRSRSLRHRMLIAAMILVGWFTLAFEILPRASMALMREQLPGWSETALGLQRPDTWTTMGLVEHAAAVDPALFQAEIAGRAHSLLILLLALVPLLPSSISSRAPVLAVLAALGGACAGRLAPPGWPAFVAGPVIVAACMVACLRGGDPPDPDRASMPVVARGLLALVLALGAFALARWACQVDWAAAAFWTGLLGA